MIFKRLFLGLLLTAMLVQSNGQSGSLKGRLFDEQARPLASGTIVLLNPIDSTLEFFAISNGSGTFEIRNIREGTYLLQASFVGFKAFYSPLNIPRPEGSNVGDIILQAAPEGLVGAEVVGEAVPLQIHGDTIEYNAAAFKTRPDAMTEELLKKLPGVEVDRAGNIKALGEDVSTLYVDGKEFFGSDPTIATRNIPADAIDKVQVYDKKSDAAEFTGIDDGTRNKTVNLELKEEHKKGVFGDVLAGYGTDQHYKAAAKAYRFTDKVQMAGLGMINNVNEYGFSFSDYMNFKGGISAMTGGGGSVQMTFGDDGELPINFGQPLDGLTSSGAGGLNFSYSTSKHNRNYISYLINGSDKDLERSTYTERYLEDGQYTTDEQLEQQAGDLSHRINFGLRRRIDSTHNLIVEGNVGLMYGDLHSLGETQNFQSDQLVNHLLSDRAEFSDRLSGNMNTTYYRMVGKNHSALKLNAKGAFSKAMDEISIDNQTNVFPGMDPELFNQFQDNRSDLLRLSFLLSYTQKIGKGLYLDPVLRLGGIREELDRVQGPLENGQVPVDSVSPSFAKDYRWLRPGLTMRWNTKKSQLALGMNVESGILETSLNEGTYPRSDYLFFMPVFSWDYARQTGRKLSISYASSVNAPTVRQLLPVINYLNPLSLYHGNPGLQPEQSHSLGAHWLIFDQFSMTSLMMMWQAGYTHHKINWATTVSDELVQISTLENVDWDYQAGFSADFSTPIRRLGIKINLKAAENWNRGLSLVNGLDNAYHSLNQDYSLSVSNRKKNIWDVVSGVSVSLTQSWYDIQESLDTRYFDASWFADLRFTPNENWNFECSADLTNYSDLAREESIQVPLLRAEISHFFLANKRGVLTLSAHDLLDRNQNVARLSELNYLRETRSNTIGRYFMLSFKYRLNKFAKNGGGIEVDVHRRR